MEKPSIEDVMNRHEDRIMGLKNVVGIGIGEKETGVPCILVFVGRRDPETERSIPRELDGYPVKIEEIGEVRAL